MTRHNQLLICNHCRGVTWCMDDLTTCGVCGKHCDAPQYARPVPHEHDSRVVKVSVELIEQLVVRWNAMALKVFNHGKAGI